MIINLLQKAVDYVISSTKGELKLNINGFEVIAEFAKERNDDLIKRIQEILIGYTTVNKRPEEIRKTKKQEAVV